MTPLGAVHHLAIATPEPRRLAAFYSSVLGLAELRVWHDDQQQLRSVWLGLGEAVLMIERGTSANARPPPGEFHAKAQGLHLFALRIAVSDREQWRARLAQHGVAIESESAYSLFFYDADGNRIALSHFPDSVGIIA